MKRRATIDRIVDEKQVVLLIGDEEQEYVLPLDELPPGVKEGTQLEVNLVDGVIQEFSVLEEETLVRQKQIIDKLQLLQKRGSNLHRRK